MSFIFWIYTFLLITTILKGKVYYFVLILLAIVIHIIAHKIIKQKRIKKIKEKVKIVCEQHSKGETFEPFIKVNKEPWYILECIPGVSRIGAKSLAEHVKEKGIVTNFIDFANITNLEIPIYELVKKIIIF